MPIYATEHLTNNEAAFYNEQEAAISQNVARIENIRGIDSTPKMQARNGRFTASRISELLAGGSGKTRLNYIIDVALQHIGIEKDFDTPEMKHGRVNQKNAFDFVIKPIYPEAKWYDEYIAINAHCGASPDILVGNIPIDVKCPYNIFGYMNQANNPPKKYLTQVQMQMMATGAKEGYLVFYLTKPEMWGDDEWDEYPFSLDDRYHIEPIKYDEQLQWEILEAVKAAVPVKRNIVDKLLAAKLVSEYEFFYAQLGGSRFRKLKEASNILKEDYIRVKNEFYYLVK